MTTIEKPELNHSAYEKLWQSVTQAESVGGQGESGFPLDVALTHLEQLRRSRDGWKTDCEREAMNARYWQEEYVKRIERDAALIQERLNNKKEDDMQAIQREDRRQPIASLTEANLEPSYTKPDSITEVLERECMETFYAVEETEKLLREIVMKQIGKPPEPVKPLSGEVRVDPQGSLNIAIQSLRDMRVKLSLMRADVARLM